MVEVVQATFPQETLFPITLSTNEERDTFSTTIQGLNQQHSEAAKIRSSAMERTSTPRGPEYIVVDRSTYDQAQKAIDHISDIESGVRANHWEYLLGKANQEEAKTSAGMMLEVYQGTLWFMQYSEIGGNSNSKLHSEKIADLHAQSVNQLNEFAQENRDTWNEVVESAKSRGQVFFVPSQQSDKAALAA